MKRTAISYDGFPNWAYRPNNAYGKPYNPNLQILVVTRSGVWNMPKTSPGALDGDPNVCCTRHATGHDPRNRARRAGMGSNGWRMRLELGKPRVFTSVMTLYANGKYVLVDKLHVR
jgi:hypothetical protein